MTIYPNGIDSILQLPTVAGVTPEDIAINAIRGATIAIETELGIDPKGIYSDVATRFAILESRVGPGPQLNPGSIDINTQTVGILSIARGGTALNALGALDTVLTSTGSTLFYKLLTDSNIDPAAAIAGTKINSDFGSQTIITTGAVQIAGPTITSGTGAPVSSPPNGSIYLRQDGTFSTGLYLRETGSWSAIVPFIIGGADTQVQFNDGGTIAGNANFTFDKTTNTVSATNFTGLLKELNNTKIATFRNALNTADVTVLESDSSDNLYVGTNAAFTSQQPSILRIAGNSQVIIGTTTNRNVTAEITSTTSGQPIVGDTNMSSPYGAHGEIPIDMSPDVDYTLLSTDYRYFVINTTGAITADRTITIPAPTSDDRSYTKFIRNNCTGAFNIIVSTGVGSTVSVPNGSTAIIAADNTTGVTKISTSPAGTTNDIQINTSGIFGVDTGKFTYDPTTHSFSASGSNTVAGSNSGAIGTGHTVSGPNSFAAGNGCTASSSNTIALGVSSAATGADSVAIGDSNTASGTASCALGITAVASRWGELAHSGEAPAGGEGLHAVDLGVHLIATPGNLTLGDSTEITLEDTKLYSMRVRVMAVDNTTPTPVTAHEVHEILALAIGGTLTILDDAIITPTGVNFATAGWTLAISAPAGLTFRINVDPVASDINTFARVEWSAVPFPI